jgi:hypothetical protein
MSRRAQRSNRRSNVSSSENRGVTLSLAGLKDELPKAAKLAHQGLAEDYVILTNAAVSSDDDQQTRSAFEAVGVTKGRVFAGSWIIQELTKSPRLRMLVSRFGRISPPLYASKRSFGRFEPRPCPHVNQRRPRAIRIHPWTAKPPQKIRNPSE